MKIEFFFCNITKRKNNTMSILSFVILALFLFATEAKQRLASYARCHEGNLVWDLPSHRKDVLPEEQKRLMTCMCLEKLFPNSETTCPVLLNTEFRHVYEADRTYEKWRYYEDRCPKTKASQGLLWIPNILFTSTLYFMTWYILEKLSTDSIKND
jgi:hypothetical protein